MTFFIMHDDFLHPLHFISLRSKCSPKHFVLKHTSVHVVPSVSETEIQTHYKKFWAELIDYFRLYDTDRIENDAYNNSIVACVFVAAVTFLLSRSIATIGGIYI
jgi:hypothetical protein